MLTHRTALVLIWTMAALYLQLLPIGKPLVMSADADLAYIYLPTGVPANDW